MRNKKRKLNIRMHSKMPSKPLIMMQKSKRLKKQK